VIASQKQCAWQDDTCLAGFGPEDVATTAELDIDGDGLWGRLGRSGDESVGIGVPLLCQGSERFGIVSS